MATVIITGASGFLGRHLAARLTSAGFSVTLVSRHPVAGMYQVADYSETPGGDILIHLAEEPDRGKVNQLGEAYIKHSSAIVKTLASRMYQKVIYASSGVVYGDQNEYPCRVDAPVTASDTYSKSKLLNERIILDSGGIVARISNLFGVGMSANNVMSDIIRQLPGPGALRIRDDKPVRDYLSVSDAARAIHSLAESNYCGIMNIGSGTGKSVRGLAELLLSLVGQEAREIIATKPSSRRSINILDISETTKMISWSPTSLLKDQLTQLISDKVTSYD